MKPLNDFRDSMAQLSQLSAALAGGVLLLLSAPADADTAIRYDVIDVPASPGALNSAVDAIAAAATASAGSSGGAAATNAM